MLLRAHANRNRALVRSLSTAIDEVLAYVRSPDCVRIAEVGFVYVPSFDHCATIHDNGGNLKSEVFWLIRGNQT